jgi:hypothetical protein
MSKGANRSGRRRKAVDARALEIEYLEGELEALAEKEREEVGMQLSYGYNGLFPSHAVGSWP